jgi:hypothetical protein
VPARTDTRWWHEWATQATEIQLVQGRLRFGDAEHAAPFPSAVLVFRPPDATSAPAEPAPLSTVDTPPVRSVTEGAHRVSAVAVGLPTLSTVDRAADSAAPLRCRNQAAVFRCPGDAAPGQDYCDACRSIGWERAPATDDRHQHHREDAADD